MLFQLDFTFIWIHHLIVLENFMVGQKLSFACKGLCWVDFLRRSNFVSEQEQTRNDAKVSQVMDITPPNADF